MVKRSDLNGVRVDSERMLRRLEELGEIGADPQGGVTRPGFGQKDREAQRHLVRDVIGHGLDARVDPAGNLIFSRTETTGGPRLIMGSHLDTVVNGGRLDGVYGVVAALEVLHIFSDLDLDLGYEPVVVAFANEEGALFPYPFWGSLALTGRLDRLPRNPVDSFGRSLREPLALAGGDLDRLGEAAWPLDSIRAYLELHIEQGPVLEGTATNIGVVDAIVGRTVFEVHVHGEAGHAGTRPMKGRRDALVAAGHLVLSVECLARGGACHAATTGRMSVHQGTTNVIPALVTASVEIRDGSSVALAEAEERFRAELEAIEEKTGCEIEVKVLTRVDPTSTDGDIRRMIAEAADGLGLSSRVLSSGAGHDAQIMGAGVPMGMVFVPSKGGVSHVPEEHTDHADLVAGADVLLRTALTIDG